MMEALAPLLIAVMLPLTWWVIASDDVILAHREYSPSLTGRKLPPPFPYVGREAPQWQQTTKEQGSVDIF